MTQNNNMDVLLYLHNNNKNNNNDKIYIKEYFSDNCSTQNRNHDFYQIKKSSNMSTHRKINYYQCQNCSVIYFK